MLMKRDIQYKKEDIMWTIKLALYSLVAMGLFATNASHALGEGTGNLSSCKLKVVEMWEGALKGAYSKINHKMGEGEGIWMFIRVTVNCREKVNDVHFTAWTPSGMMLKQPGSKSLNVGDTVIDNSSAWIRKAEVGAYRFEIRAAPRVARGQQVESVIRGGITLEVDPTPCPRNIKPPVSIRYGS